MPATRVAPAESTRKRKPFDITEYPIPAYELPRGLWLELRKVSIALPPRASQGPRPKIDEAKFLLLLAESLWASRKRGCVQRSNADLAADMTRRLRSRGETGTVSHRQVEAWLSARTGRASARRRRAVELVREVLVMYKRRTERKTRRGMRPGKSKLMLHGQPEYAVHEFHRDGE